MTVRMRRVFFLLFLFFALFPENIFFCSFINCGGRRTYALFSMCYTPALGRDREGGGYKGLCATRVQVI